MKIAIGSDHAGFEYKEMLRAYITEKYACEVIDCGTYSTDSCDYPVFAKAVCARVAEKNATFGILVCGTGIGMSIAANKQKGIRAAVASDEYSTKFTRLHNDANVLCMGARVIAEEKARILTDIFLTTEFEGGKHLRRVSMFEED